MSAKKELESVRQALKSVEGEIQDLEQSLENARKKKTDLLNQQSELERRIKSEAAPPPAAAAAAAPPKGETPEELQARIAELQRQIEEAENQKKNPRQRSRSPSGKKLGQGGGSSRSAGKQPETAPAPAAAAEEADSPEKNEKKGGWRLFGGRNNKKGKESSATTDDASPEEEEAPAPAPAPAPVETSAPAPAPSAGRFSQSLPSAVVVQPSEAADYATPAAASGAGGGGAADAGGASGAAAGGGGGGGGAAAVGSKASLDWERPQWAHAMNKQDQRAVDSDAINNPQLQETKDGYRRQVFEKDLDIQRGKFVEKTTKTPDPRLAWIVLRIDGKGVPGKVVMHLYGKDLQALVDQFAAIKDSPVAPGGPNKASLTVQCTPPLHVVVFGGPGLDGKAGVYGVVQEGHDIVERVASAGGGGSKLSVKQAHVFPVKKSKSAL